jgi:glutamate synthase domain-containing protein 2
LEEAKIKRITKKHRGSFTFPGLKDMLESTFHYLYSIEQLDKHITSLKLSRKVYIKLCIGCVTCKSEGENCNKLQLSSEFFPFLS